MTAEYELRGRLEQLELHCTEPTRLNEHHHAEIRRLDGEIAKARAEVEKWKRRAAQHGCNVEEGDHECG